MVSDKQSRKEHKSTSKSSIHGSKSNHGVTKQASTSGLGYVINTLRANGHSPLLENFIRGLVREVVETKVQEYLVSRSKVNEAGISGARPLELRFIDKKLPDTIFTQSNIIAKDGPPLRIALFDVKSQSIVNDGPLSSIKIEICPLNGEFGSCGSHDDWTENEFNAKIVQERDGKQPLLVGERFITLKNGIACISKIIFTDNSRWLRGQKFRLGVKAVLNGENIKEGRSEPFRVKDNRGESYKKHFPPFLNDDVWRLKKIAKDGELHKKLSRHRIHTVKDLLQLLIINESSLNEIFGKIPKKSWLTIIEHAKSCVVDDNKLYSYENVTIGQPILLLFNAIYKLVGVTYDTQDFYLPDTLNPSLKSLVEIVKKEAYKNVDVNLEPIDESVLNSISLAACLKSAGQSVAPVQGLQHIDISIVQGQNEIGPGYVQPCTFSTSYVNEGMNNCQINDGHVPDIRELLPQNNQMEGEIHIEGNMYGSQFPDVQDGFSTENLINMSPFYTTWGLGNEISFDIFDGAECSTHVNFINSAMDISSSGKTKAVWRKIRAVIKWGISVRRVVAAKKNFMGYRVIGAKFPLSINQSSTENLWDT